MNLSIVCTHTMWFLKLKSIIHGCSPLSVHDYLQYCQYIITDIAANILSEIFEAIKNPCLSLFDKHTSRHSCHQIWNCQNTHTQSFHIAGQIFGPCWVKFWNYLTHLTFLKPIKNPCPSFFNKHTSRHCWHQMGIHIFRLPTHTPKHFI